MSNIPLDVMTGIDVVVVDDEFDSLEVARYILAFYGATVHTAENGVEGLELLKTVRPRFIISDISMPKMDGWTFISKIREDETLKDIPVIALTAHAMRGDRERVMAAGFHHYMIKPLTPSTFIEQVIRILIDIPEFATLFKHVEL
ncbi:MAG: response regulator [Phototrophicales bacterium]|nr:MAG: response regulator [Phototrophicales bacterium]